MHILGKDTDVQQLIVADDKNGDGKVCGLNSLSIPEFSCGLLQAQMSTLHTGLQIEHQRKLRTGYLQVHWNTRPLKTGS